MIGKVTERVGECKIQKQRERERKREGVRER